ncbi:MAG: cellulase family glycosylhydrolase [Ruminiclostridium sp.]|nr:cellulase family glycosylhydrolase [Ruminiclostridium sp.]
MKEDNTVMEENEKIKETEISEAEEKSLNYKLPKWVYIAFAGMGAVIIALVIILIVVLCGNNNTNSQNSASGSVTQSDNGKENSQVNIETSDNSETQNDDTESKPETTQNQQNNESKPEGTTSSSPTEDKEPLAEGFNLKYSTDNSWVDGDTTMYGVQFGVTNNSSSDLSGGWELVMTIEGLVSCSGWNGTYTADGNKLVIKNAEYNGDIFKGGTVVVGGNVGVKGELKVSDAKINGIACTVTVGAVNQNNQNNNNQGNNNDNNNNSEPAADVEELLERSEDAVQGDDWLYTDGNRILDKDGKQVWLTGVNWFGYNTGTNTFDGLWNSQLKPSVEAIADHGFNLIRVPISAELINSWAAGEYPKANYNNAYNTELNNMNSLQIFDYFLKLAEENGLKVMPDIHSAETNASGHVVNLWYTDKVSAEDFYSALEWMADRYKDNDTIIAYDLKNEPHGKPFEGDGAAIWNDSTKPNNWKYVAEQAAARILAKNPNVLILVEGTEIYPMDLNTNSDFHSTNEKDYYFNWWGGNLRGVRDYPVNLGKYQNKLVYSPHDYGPTVYKQPWFEGDYDYDSLMKDCWKDNWLYIYTDNIAPLLIGEWGGFMKEPNLKWMTHMRELISNYHLNHTFWCYNANSGDTGGLVLDDFKTWDEEKYAFVKEVLWQENGKFVGLDHAIPLGDNGITLNDAKGLS